MQPRKMLTATPLAIKRKEIKNLRRC